MKVLKAGDPLTILEGDFVNRLQEFGFLPSCNSSCGALDSARRDFHPLVMPALRTGRQIRSVTERIEMAAKRCIAWQHSIVSGI